MDFEATVDIGKEQEKAVFHLPNWMEKNDIRWNRNQENGKERDCNWVLPFNGMFGWSEPVGNGNIGKKLSLFTFLWLCS